MCGYSKKPTRCTLTLLTILVSYIIALRLVILLITEAWRETVAIAGSCMFYRPHEEFILKINFSPSVFLGLEMTGTNTAHP